MAMLREIKSIKIPILLTKDKLKDGSDAFLLTCKPLSIYTQAKSPETAINNFKTSIDCLMKHLIENKRLIKFFEKRNLIETDKFFIGKTENIEKLRKLEPHIKAHIKTIENLELGSYAKAEIELAEAEA